jgi:hypothetical protein
MPSIGGPDQPSERIGPMPHSKALRKAVSAGLAHAASHAACATALQVEHGGMHTRFDMADRIGRQLTRRPSRLNAPRLMGPHRGLVCDPKLKAKTKSRGPIGTECRDPMSLDQRRLFEHAAPQELAHAASHAACATALQVEHGAMRTRLDVAG